MRMAFKVGAVLLATAGFASAEPFGEVTVGVPVSSLVDAEVWYGKFLGPDVEVLKPDAGILEYKAAPGVWLQLYEVSGQPSVSVVRFLVEIWRLRRLRVLRLALIRGKRLKFQVS